MRKISRTTALLLCFSLGFGQAGFAQAPGMFELPSVFQPHTGSENFRPLHLRSISYDQSQDNFRLFLDTGDAQAETAVIEETTVRLMEYFMVGISLPEEAFWVNLRPDGESKVIEEGVAQTDVGRIMLEADVQLKKDLALRTSPQTASGREYWNKLYQRAEQIYGSEDIVIPTLSRPWIVPDEIIVSEARESAYVYKATLKVMLEQDYLKKSVEYNFNDDRAKRLNEYASQLIRDLILPDLIREINSSRRYAALRQVYYSLILAQWFKRKFICYPGASSRRIDTGNLDGVTSRERWSVSDYVGQYRASFKDGEYKLTEQVVSASGPRVRTYFSGGVVFSFSDSIERSRVPNENGFFDAPGTHVVAVEGQGSEYRVLPGGAEGFSREKAAGEEALLAPGAAPGEIVSALRQAAGDNGETDAPGSVGAQPGKLGGIDLRSLPIVKKSVDNLFLAYSQPYPAASSEANAEREARAVQRMAAAGILPSSERLKGYVQDRVARSNKAGDIRKVVSTLADVCRAEESSGRSSGVPVRDTMVAISSGMPVSEMRQVFAANK